MKKQKKTKMNLFQMEEYEQKNRWWFSGDTSNVTYFKFEGAAKLGAFNSIYCKGCGAGKKKQIFFVCFPFPTPHPKKKK